jgi:hypothetical protein
MPTIAMAHDERRRRLELGAARTAPQVQGLVFGQDVLATRTA